MGEEIDFFDQYPHLKTHPNPLPARAKDEIVKITEEELKQAIGPNKEEKPPALVIRKTECPECGSEEREQIDLKFPDQCHGIEPVWYYRCDKCGAEYHDKVKVIS